ncbi:MAG: hypothetical protein ACREN4_07995 [Candidatus Dormibacteria bacterium]
MVERAAADAMAALDAAGLDDLAPGAGVLRFLELTWQTSTRYPFLWYLPQVGETEDVDRHGPALDHVRDLIARAQHCEDIDTDLSPAWLLSAGLALGRSAETEVKEGRMTTAEATQSWIHSMVRLLGLRPHDATVPGPR